MPLDDSSNFLHISLSNSSGKIALLTFPDKYAQEIWNLMMHKKTQDQTAKKWMKDIWQPSVGQGQFQ